MIWVWERDAGGVVASGHSPASPDLSPDISRDLTVDRHVDRHIQTIIIILHAFRVVRALRLAPDLAQLTLAYSIW